LTFGHHHIFIACSESFHKETVNRKIQSTVNYSLHFRPWCAAELHT